MAQCFIFFYLSAVFGVSLLRLRNQIRRIRSVELKHKVNFRLLSLNLVGYVLQCICQTLVFGLSLKQSANEETHKWTMEHACKV